jgi:hypothetical protein
MIQYEITYEGGWNVPKRLFEPALEGVYPGRIVGDGR